MPDQKAGSVLRRLRKILALAERGERHERETARAHLEHLLQHHGLSIEDVIAEDEGEAQLCTFQVDGPLEARLLRQVIAMVTNSIGVRQFRRGRSRKHLAYMLTRAQYAQATFVFGITRQALERELDVTFKAFVQVHDLFPQEDPPGQAQMSTPEQAAELVRLYARMGTMDKTPLPKAIAGPESPPS
ncbi:DUF2786 domain-containing protein [Rhodanobacter thiooxydans]|uniref:DUF2786 domain-containing protein n=1 Tax=Rhodanobacter thiooxydans TaxID=416169 RepID=UPI000B291B7F|nr:DUF2786 domain-containing protein [Rhodanobacter thiooxydans]UJJ56703.1 DUF2786 domain-containing protein [Rhodanobacter thiooxydans]